MISVPMTTDTHNTKRFEPRDAVAALYVDAQLARLVPVIIDALNPVQVWLFGSRAEGRAGSASDYDVLVVLDDDAPAAAFDPRAAFGLADVVDVTADIIPVTAREFDDDKDILDTLARAAWLRGKCLYERSGSHRRLPQDG